MGRQKTTIEDIARSAGVGLGTVSRVLNNSSHVSDETRARVLKVVKECGYQPNATAAKLARKPQRDSTVGLLLPDIGNHFFFEIFEVIHGMLRSLGIDLVVFNYERHNPRVMQKVLDTDIGGLLIFAFQLDKTELELVKARNISYMYVDWPAQDEHCIYCDYQAGGARAAEYLVDKGVTHPAYITVDAHSRSSIVRATGFKEALAQSGIYHFDTFPGTLSEESGYMLAKQIVNTGRHDGIFCFCDEIAIGANQAIHEMQAPVRIIGFDGLRIARIARISTVSQDPISMGKAAASRIVALMEANNPGEVRTCLRIEPVLIDRNS